MVPHVAARKTHQRLLKFSFDTPKRLFQQYLPTTEVALIRSSRHDGRHPWLRWSFMQPGLPQSFFISREVFGTPIRAQHVFEIGNT
jgi:hypothetical protein